MASDPASGSDAYDVSGAIRETNFSRSKMHGVMLTATYLAYSPDASVDRVARALKQNSSTVKTWLREVRRIAAEFEREEKHHSEKSGSYNSRENHCPETRLSNDTESADRGASWTITANR